MKYNNAQGKVSWHNEKTAPFCIIALFIQYKWQIHMYCISAGICSI